MKTNLQISLILMGFTLLFLMSVESIAQFNWTKYENNPVMQVQPGTWYAWNVFYPEVIYEDGLYKMWFCGNNSSPGRHIGYASSSDGINWDIKSPPVIMGGEPGTWAMQIYPGSVIRINDTLRMWFSGSNSSSSIGSIGYAWSVEEHVWNIVPNPVLEGGPGGWDYNFAFHPSVTYDGTMYHMYYSGLSSGESFQIGYATSLDGINWEKYSINDPLIPIGPPGSIYDGGLWYSRTVMFNDTLRMYFTGSDGTSTYPPYYSFWRIGYAWSTDYLDWNISLDTILDVGEPGTWDESLVAGPSVMIHEGQFKMWYWGDSYNSNWEIGYAFCDNAIIRVPSQQPTIQAGIDAACSGAIVLVDEGTYYENINFKGKAITVASQFLMDGDETHIENTIIDGSQPTNPDTASVVSFVSGEDTTSILCGFTIQNGTGTYNSSWDGRVGGGITCDNAGPKIIHNHIKDNELSYNYRVYGGGIQATDISNDHVVIIRSNIIENNELSNTAFYPGGAIGAGIEIYEINCIIEDNHIISNTTVGRPYGVGVSAIYCHAYIRNNTIEDNKGTLTTDSGRGAGIYLENNYPGTEVTGNTIIGNELEHFSGTQSGGGGIGLLNIDDVFYNEVLISGNTINNNAARNGAGIYVKRGFNSKIFNNIIQGNEANSKGGGIFYTYSSKSSEGIGCGLKTQSKNHSKSNLEKEILPVLINNTISDNSSVSYGGGIANNMGSDFIILNNIIYNNTSSTQGNEMYLYVNSDAFLYNNIIDTNEIAGNGSWEGAENIDDDPLFASDGFHLTQGSPCLDAGLISIEIDGEMYYCPDFDIDGQPRPLNETAEIGVDELLITGIPNNFTSINNSLIQISPNPCSNAANLIFTIEEQGLTICDIYKISGTKVKGLVHEVKSPGTYKLEINLSDLPVDVYFCVLKTNNGIQTKKIIKL